MKRRGASDESVPTRLRQYVTDDVLVTDADTTAKFTVQGLSQDFCNRAGVPSLEKISKVFECARVTAVYNPEFLFVKTVTGSDKTAFIILINMEIERDMYRRARKNKWLWPLDLTTTIAGFGNTSVDYVSLIQDSKDGLKLGMLKFKYVTVDFATRKSVAIPAEFKEPYSKFLKPHLTVQAYKPVARPAQAHRMTITVEPSDIDSNQHLNNSCYMRMCEDSAAEACQEGRLMNFAGDFTDYQAKSIKAQYHSECLVGDVLDIYCWEDKINKLILHFEVLRDDKISFRCQIEFYVNVYSRL